MLDRCEYDRLDLESGRGKLKHCSYKCNSGQREVQPARCSDRSEPRIRCSRRDGIALNGRAPMTCANRTRGAAGALPPGPGSSDAELGQLAWSADGSLLVVAGGDSATVQQVDPAAGTTTTRAGVAGDLTPLSAAPAQPVATTPVGRVDGVAMRANGNVLFASQDNGYIAEASSTVVQRIAGAAGSGDATLVYGEGEQASGAFLLPGALLLAPSGRLFFTEPDKGVIRALELDGSLKTIAGLNATAMAGPASRELGYAGETGPARDARFSHVGGLALDVTGRYLYATDDVANVVRRIDLATGLIEKVAGTAGASASSGNGLDGVFAGFAEATDVAVGSDGAVYVLDGADELIRRVDPCTERISTFVNVADLGNDDVADPRSLVVGPSEALFWTGWVGADGVGENLFVLICGVARSLS